VGLCRAYLHCGEVKGAEGNAGPALACTHCGWRAEATNTGVPAQEPFFAGRAAPSCPGQVGGRLPSLRHVRCRPHECIFNKEMGASKVSSFLGGGALVVLAPWHAELGACVCFHPGTNVQVDLSRLERRYKELQRQLHPEQVCEQYQQGARMTEALQTVRMGLFRRSS